MVEELVGDPRFFARRAPHRLSAIRQAARISPPEGDALGETCFAGVASLHSARSDQVSFLDNRRYLDVLAQTDAGAVILHPQWDSRLPAGCIGLFSAEPYLAWARVCALFYPAPPVTPGRHPTALVDPSAQVDQSAAVGPYAVIGAGVRIGPGCRIEAHVVLGQGVIIGAGCTLGNGVSVSHAILGERVRIYPGVRIGQDGFGFAPDGNGGYVSVPQLGRVVIEHDVEIGANTTIDRGSMHDTVIGAGSRIDNLVQIGHNVQCGQGCVIVSQTGISGSTILGDHVMTGGQAGLAGHLHIGRAARIGAQAGVMADVAAGANVIGSPAQPVREFFREVAMLRRRARDRSRGTDVGASSGRQDVATPAAAEP